MDKSLLMLDELPEGTTLRDLPAFADVEHEFMIGPPAPECAGCGKPFNAERQRSVNVDIVSPALPVPMVIRFYLCGHCRDLCRQGGAARDGVLAGVQAYWLGEGRPGN
jgi:hypothetical protein